MSFLELWRIHRIMDLHHIVIRFSLLALFLWPYFSTLDHSMCLSHSEKTHDLNPIGVQLCQYVFGSGFNGLRFDHATNNPIKIVETIKNPKSLKHKSCENQSPDLFIFFEIF